MGIMQLYVMDMDLVAWETTGMMTHGDGEDTAMMMTMMTVVMIRG